MEERNIEEETKEMGGESLTESAETIEFLIDKTHDILYQCRGKMHVFHELFGSLNEHDSDDFSDFYGFCLGMETICSEIIDKLLVAEDYVGNIKDKAWMFTEEAKIKYPRLRRIVEDANEAVKTNNASLLISTLTSIAERLKKIEDQKK